MVRDTTTFTGWPDCQKVHLEVILLDYKHSISGRLKEGIIYDYVNMHLILLFNKEFLERNFMIQLFWKW